MQAIRGLRVRSGNGTAGTADPFLAKLVKLVPAEVVSLYMAGSGIIQTDAASKVSLLAGWTGVCLVLVVLVRARATRSATGRTQWSAVAIAAVSYVVWVYAMGGVFASYPSIHSPVLGALAVLLWTFVAPMLVRAD